MPEINREWEVTIHDVKTMLDAKSPFVLIDVREKDEFQTCRIDGATLVPLSEIERRVDEIRDLADGRPVICHCHHGHRSLRAAMFLRSAGIAGVKSMAGGIDGWSAEIDPKVPRY